MTSEGIFNTFPNAVLTPLPLQRPTAQTIELLQQEVSTNAISVFSTRGNGMLGHFALAVQPAVYNAAAGVNFDPPLPAVPGSIHPVGATAPIITKANRQFVHNQQELSIYASTDAKLKQQILAAVPATYTNALKYKYLGYTNVTTLAILTHLQEKYGTITTHVLNINMENLH
jgi:hypothetical protein